MSAADPDADADIYPDGHAHCLIDRYGHADCDADGHEHRVINADRYPHAIGDVERDRYSHGDGYSDAGQHADDNEHSNASRSQAGPGRHRRKHTAPESEADRRHRERTNQLGSDDEHTEGNITEVDLDADPPFLLIGTRDGAEQLLHLLRTQLSRNSGWRLC